MDMETSLSRIVLSAIPAKGATWGDIRREVQGPSNETLECCLKGLRAGGILRRIAKGEVGIWYRTEHAPKPDVEKPPRVLSPAEIQQRRINGWKVGQKPRPVRYDKHGRRYCTRRSHYVPVNQFPSGPAKDGLHAWCRSCKKLAMREFRNGEKS